MFFSTFTILILAGISQVSLARPIDQNDLVGMEWDSNLQQYVKPAPAKWWTYHFGRGKFTSGIWSDILRPTGKFGCILVVQQKAQLDDLGGASTQPGWTSAKYFPYCSPGAGQKAAEKPLEELGLTLYDSPRQDQGENWYILDDLRVPENKDDNGGAATTVEAGSVKHYTLEGGELKAGSLDAAGRKRILGIKGKFPNPKYWSIGNNVDVANYNVAQSVFVVRE